MIKLFWNTQNQAEPTPQNKNAEEQRNYIWGQYHKNNSDKWIYKILEKIKYQVIHSEKDVQNEDVLIIIDSSIEKKFDLYTKLQLACKKLFLIHLGDESGAYDLSEIYKKFNYIWRTFCSGKYFNNNKNISCLPLGFKSGTSLKHLEGKRNYKWAFVGTPHKSSRHDLLFHLSEVSPSFSHKTSNFNKNIINVEKMSEVLSSTEFIPCPNGFVHPETYRLYEALECGCIPIVENTYKYYDRLFPDNPFLKIDKWSDAKTIIKEWQAKEIKKKQEECALWWASYKIKLQESLKKKLIDEAK